jgi:hypothetical protein
VPDILQFEAAFVNECRQQGIPVYAHNMFRTPDEQYDMFVRGVSKNDGSGPYAHMGFAVDIVHAIHHWNIDRRAWDIMGHIGYEVAFRLNLDMEWGGQWADPWDPAHWELADWRQRHATSEAEAVKENRSNAPHFS